MIKAVDCDGRGELISNTLIVVVVVVVVVVIWNTCEI